MSEPEYVTLTKAAELLTYSEPTVRRMLRDAVLDHYGARALLRISVASIREYQEGKRTWHRSENRGSDAARAAQAPSSGSGTGRTSPARRIGRAVVDFPLDRKATGRPKKH